MQPFFPFAGLCRSYQVPIAQEPIVPVVVREGIENEEGDPTLVAPLRRPYEDVAMPFEAELCDCHEFGADGYVDMTLKFDTEEVVEELQLGDVAGQTVKLTLTGELWGENGEGTPIRGADCVWVLSTGRKDKNGK